MLPAGYMRKKIWLEPAEMKLANVTDIYSVSNCLSEPFADYINFWKHNGYWFYDSPEIIKEIAKSENIGLDVTQLFYYEIHKYEYGEDEKIWQEIEPEESFVTNIRVPNEKKLEGWDVVTYHADTSPECSPLSCNGLGEEIPVNQHCLLGSFDEAKQLLETGKFDKSEPGPFRIFAIYTLPGES